MIRRWLSARCESAAAKSYQCSIGEVLAANRMRALGLHSEADYHQHASKIHSRNAAFFWRVAEWLKK